MRSKSKIGDILVQVDLITPEQLARVLETQKKTGKRFGQTLIDLEYISESDLLNTLSQQLNLPLVDLIKTPLNTDVARQLPEMYARQYHALLLENNPDFALVAMEDPFDILAFDEISRFLAKPMKAALIRNYDLQRNLNLIYRKTAELTDIAAELGDELEKKEIELDALIPANVVDAPVRKFIQTLFEDAVQINASDIHIEPGNGVLRIRLRVDGVLQEQLLDQKQIVHGIAAGIAQRLKLMAGLNMAEKRLPLDGRFSIRIKKKVIDVRLSTMPIEYGESIVMRLLDQSSDRVMLDESGMPYDMLAAFRKMLRIQHGMILLTGPTGSGKTTTLYAALGEINSPDVKILTIEDPVEYKMDRLCQIQVNAKIGLDFAHVLRSILRQDPDVILLGEMRDQETASIAMRASLTGHLVLSTLHTNDTASTATRLLDMGIPGYLIAATLHGILAQRLLRKICNYCKEPYTLNQMEKQWLIAHHKESAVDAKFFIGKGCNYCNKVGYTGRTGIFECLLLDDKMIAALSNDNQLEFMSLAYASIKGKALLDRAVAKAVLGLTTVSEVMRIAEGGE